MDEKLYDAINIVVKAIDEKHRFLQEQKPPREWEASLEAKKVLRDMQERLTKWGNI